MIRFTTSPLFQHCLTLQRKELEASGAVPKKHVIWSGRCSSQFKGKEPWYFMSRYPTIGGCACSWNFFGSRHGKGPHDGAGAVVKRYIRQAQPDPHGQEMNCVKHVVKMSED